MEANLYKPPEAKLLVADSRPGSIPKAVGIGVLIEVGGTVLASLATSFLYAVVLGVQGYSREEMAPLFEAVDPLSTYGMISSFIGTLVSVLAGYQCAVVARSASYKAPCAVAACSLIFGLALGSNAYPWDVLAVYCVLSVAAVLGGSWLAMRRFQPR